MFVASRQGGRKTALELWVRARLAESVGPRKEDSWRARPMAWDLYTGSFKQKSVIQFSDVETGRCLAVVKVLTGLPAGNGTTVEMVNRGNAQACLEAAGLRLIGVHTPWGR